MHEDSGKQQPWSAHLLAHGKLIRMNQESKDGLLPQSV